MNWEIVGSTGEWVGALVVVATLFYLGRQVKQQNRIARYTALKDLMDAINQPNQMLAENDELRLVFAKGLSQPNLLSDNEAGQFSYVFRMYWNQMIKFQRAHVTGLIDENDWVDFAHHFSQLLFSAGGSLFLEQQGHILVDVIDCYRQHYIPGEKAYDLSMGRDA